MQLIKTIKAGDALCKVYRDAEWQEYRVKLIKHGVHQAGSDYHSDDKQDALDTAQRMLEG